MDQTSVAIDHSDPAAEAVHRLGKLDADKAPAQNQEMFRNAIELQCFDMGQGVRFTKTGRRIDGRVGSRVNNDALPANDAKLL